MEDAAEAVNFVRVVVGEDLSSALPLTTHNHIIGASVEDNTAYVVDCNIEFAFLRNSLR